MSEPLLKGDSFGGIMVIEEDKGTKPLFNYRPFTKDGGIIASREIEELTQQQLFVMYIQQRTYKINQVRDHFLIEAFGLYMCGKIALAIDEPDNWSKEVDSLLFEVRRHMNRETEFKNKEKALTEAMRDASYSYHKITSARYKVESYYPSKWKEIKALNYDSKEKFRDMIEEFLPEYLHLLGVV